MKDALLLELITPQKEKTICCPKYTEDIWIYYHL